MLSKQATGQSLRNGDQPVANDPFISVVIPTYNRADRILKTLETVLDQTYDRYEVIVVDDASTDDTANMLASYAASGRIRFLRHDCHRERAAARNTGMANAKGDFLTFLDSDDLMYPSNLEDAADYISANSDVRLFQNLYELIDEQGNVLSKYSFPSLKDPLDAIVRTNFLACIGAFIHRDIYRNFTFDHNLSSSEDWDFWLRVVPYHRPGRINKINNGVVHHPGRSINRIELAELEKRLTYILEKIRADPKLSLVYDKYLRRLESGSLIYTSTVANRMCMHGTAIKYLLRAAGLDIRIIGSVNFWKALGIALARWDKGY